MVGDGVMGTTGMVGMTMGTEVGAVVVDLESFIRGIMGCTGIIVRSIRLGCSLDAP